MRKMDRDTKRYVAYSRLYHKAIRANDLRNAKYYLERSKYYFNRTEAKRKATVMGKIDP